MIIRFVSLFLYTVLGSIICLYSETVILKNTKANDSYCKNATIMTKTPGNLKYLPQKINTPSSIAFAITKFIC